jgi:hypothetical protein
MQVRRETLKPAHRLWIAIRPDRDVMYAVPHIDSRCMRMDYFRHNPFFRFVSRFVLGYSHTMDSYLRALDKATGQDVVISN